MYGKVAETGYCRSRGRLTTCFANAALGIALMVYSVYAREESRYFMAAIIVQPVRRGQIALPRASLLIFIIRL